MFAEINKQINTHLFITIIHFKILLITFQMQSSFKKYINIEKNRYQSTI